MTPVERFLADEIEAGSFPGAVALVGTRDGVLAETAAGAAWVEPGRADATADTLFDLASLTKPLCSGALAARAGSSLPLDAAPGRYVPGWKRTRYDGITVGSLLTHTSGLPAWFPFYARGEGAEAYRRTLAEIEPEAKPGERVIYSDVNFLLLGELLETVFGGPLDAAFTALVAQPAGSRARFGPVDPASAAATEKGDRFERAMTEARGLSYPRFRDGVVRGEVHDGNAYRRGGIAAHAGLFGTARDVWTLARPWLEPERATLGRDRTPDLSEARGLAWQGRRAAGSAIPRMSDRAFGHTGFTGTSLWIDPEAGLVAVLLTNRIHPVVREIPFNDVRRRFHEAVYDAFA
ncbi:MAG TPA: serine hydrolase domain-containing protein, partial [Thermoanaerobaculia bacterium]|nr:serine hydrolase domain-containing protein [Thermoanaerobaculia bacterium]